MRVPGELETEACLFHDGQARWRMIQQNARMGTVRFGTRRVHVAECGFHVQR